MGLGYNSWVPAEICVQGYAARHHLADHAGAVRFEHAWACIEELGLGRVHRISEGSKINVENNAIWAIYFMGSQD